MARDARVDDPCRVLVVDDETNLRAVLKGLLVREGYAVDEAVDGAQGLARARDRNYAAVITDLRMPGVDGMQLLATLHEEQPDLPVILLTAHGQVANAVDAMRRGAFDFLTKPFDAAELAAVLEKAATTRLLRRRDVHEPKAGVQALIGSSDAMKRLRERIEKIAPAPSNVLVLGETGTGKELVASALHHGSPRARGPFVATNCAAIPETMVEAELFGHEKGAFTGAVAARPGRLELADGGTLFLDEIGDMDLKMQPKLLRALEQREIERVGSATRRKVDLRLVAATHPDLAAKVERGAFRRDLYFRVAVLTVELPPLRERMSDLPELVEHFRRKHAARLGKTIEPAAPALLEQLRAHSYPGNVRELENLVESLVVLAGRTMRVSDLPVALGGGGTPDAAGDEPPPRDEAPSTPAPAAAPLSNATSVPPPPAPTPVSGSSMLPQVIPTGPFKEVVRDAVAALERELITRMLRETAGNVTRAAERLGRSRKGLQLKLRDLSISRFGDGPGDAVTVDEPDGPAP
jgi:DNA-binding NtrC family response regulator